ncbi:MAG TPA: hybrid sensor histidine kinase/response regulator, partial [Syntrophobacteraceae bacterium]|nr:hybrid sensor histidine kinase/response regulator [Syntrophobacteraceae bacterium]
GKGGLRGTIIDITDRKHLEAQLIQAQKMESIGTLAGGIAHDFNNLLGIIVGNISLAQTYLQSDHQPHRLLMAAEKASFQARDLVQQLIGVSHGVSMTKLTVDLTEMIRDAALFALSSSQVTCDLVLHKDLWAVICDPTLIRQAIAQVVRNACEASPQGGRIEVEARNLALEKGTIPSLQAGRYLSISITDHGPGIPPDLLPRIFDPYFSGKERGIQKGMGLGLAIVYTIVKRHEGHIEARSVVGQGTTFDIYLPATATPAIGLKAAANT